MISRTPKSNIENNKVLSDVATFDARRPWSQIIIHHSQTQDTLLSNWEAIRNYHIINKGWSDIGYHFGIENINLDYYYKVGRDLNNQGAHCENYNRTTIGICIIGNFDIAFPTYTQYKLTALLCKALMAKYKIDIKDVLPHWAYTGEKTCPGANFNMLTLRQYMNEV